MNKYSMTCTCGDKMEAEAASREEAVAKIQGMMTPDAVAQHMAQKHAGQPVPSVAEVHSMIAQSVQLSM